jgi:septum formation inhibitor MinC
MPKQPRKNSIGAKNANIRLERAQQEKVEAKILAALRSKERTKTELYSKIGGANVNGQELERILTELQEREVISHRIARHDETGVYSRRKLWGLYSHPKQVAVREREQQWQQEREESERRWEEAWAAKERREEIQHQFDEFIESQKETIMCFAQHFLTTVIRSGSRRAFLHSMSESVVRKSGMR